MFNREDRTLEEQIILAVARGYDTFSKVENHVEGHPSTRVRQELWRLIQKGTVEKTSSHSLTLCQEKVPPVPVPGMGVMSFQEWRKSWYPTADEVVGRSERLAREESRRKIQYFDLIVEACRENNEAVNPVLETGVAVRDLVRRYLGPEEKVDGV